MFKHTLDKTEHFGESLPEQISKNILKKIIKGELKAGDKIGEEEISKELNTSRAPVREALYLLQIDGVVERVPRKGTIVKSFTQKDIEDYLETIIGIIQLGIDYSKEYWTKENKDKFKALLEDSNIEYDNQNIIEYQYKAEKLFRFIIYITENIGLIRFYEEANHILNVFAQVQMNSKTMEKFHVKLKYFATTIIDSDFNKAKEAIKEAIKEGAK
ncbi:GntR family transcriptional regulator [Oceanobacillus damuensis]|uniref:GntR family transcriptional regulator n=1 Tax=Oceanobacillus damuensis TaxID=937928 RepID=UPI00082FA3E8|nr:GntR family transcriptional regulator [Oceanobacillus damuensis]